MGETIRIKENGTPKTFNVNAIKTDLSGGGTCLWVPKSDYPVDSEYLNENGTYLASDKNLKGFSSVSVNCQPNYVVGNRDGVPYHVYNQNGNLSYEELPVEIRVTKLPDKSVYKEDERIDYTGIEVTAYKQNGEKWTNNRYNKGIIPVGELYSSSVRAKNLDGHYAFGDATGIDGEIGILSKSFRISKEFYIYLYSPNVIYYGNRVRSKIRVITTCGNNTIASGWVLREKNPEADGYISKCRIIIASDNRADIENHCKILFKRDVQDIDYPDNQWRTVVDEETTITAQNYTAGGRTVWFYFYRKTLGDHEIVDATGFNTQNDIPVTPIRIAWSLVYGERGCIIRWPRYPDHKILETFVPIEIEK